MNIDGHLLDGLSVELGQRRDRVVGRVSDHGDSGHTGSLGGGLGRLDEVGDRHQQLRSGVLQLEGHLLDAVGRVDGGDRPAGHRHGVEDDRILRDVRRHDADRRARPEAGGGQSTGKPMNVIAQLGEGVGAPRGTVDHRRLVGHRLSVLEDIGGERDLGDLLIGKRAAEDV